MSYYVTLGGIYISGVTDVSLSSGRDLPTYDGLGNGKFSIPDSENLREWTISCELSVKNTRRLEHWQAAGYVFTSFETMLKTKDYSRFIVTSPLENISELVYLKQYSQKEKYLGVYDVEITVSEYKPTQIKTTDVPYISRPGKVPIPPKVTITKRNTVYSQTKKITGKTPTIPKPGDKGFIGPMPMDFKDLKTNKPVTNPAKVKVGTSYTPQRISDINFNSGAAQALYGPKRSWSEVGNTIKSTAAAAGSAIGKAFSSWQKRRADFEKKIR